MTPISVQYFLTLFEEFKNVSQGKLQAFLSIATSRVPSAVWGTHTPYATALLAAHMIASSGGAGGSGGSAGGAVTAEAVGDLSRSYSAIGADSGDQELLLTRYGALYVELRRETVVTPRVTGTTVLPFGNYYGSD